MGQDDLITNDKCILCGGVNRIPVHPFMTKDGFQHYWLCYCGMEYIATYYEDQKDYYSVSHVSGHKARHSPSSVERQTRMAEELPSHWEVKSHLDVGCGTDGLMDRIEEKYGCESEGVDYNPNFVLSHKRYNEVSEVERQYDLVTAVHVLEHSPDPINFLREIVRVSKKYIAIEVPSVGLATVKNPQHLSIFSPWTLEIITERAGIQTIKVEWVAVQVQKESTIYHTAAIVYWGMV